MSKTKDLVSMMKEGGFLDEGEHQDIIEQIIQALPVETKENMKKMMVSQQLSELKKKIK